MASRTNTGGIVPRRRNGKQQACEPCRKAKIACDHSLPVCERCKRRKVVEKCVYLDAPMTKTPEERRRTLGFSPLTPSEGPVSQESARSKTRPFIKSGGFFGPTNFSSIWKENQENLGNDDFQISNDQEPYVNSSESLQAQTFLMLAGDEYRGCSQRVHLGEKVLKALPDQNTFEFLLKWYFEKTNECVMHKPSVMTWANSFWTNFSKEMKEPRDMDDLERISTLICHNNEVAANEEFDNYESWVNSFSGVNLRWESVGSMITTLVDALISLPDRDAFFCTQTGSRCNRKQFAMEMKDCVQACVTLSNYMDLINMQMVSLLAKNMILQTVLSGDTSLLVWRQLGDLVSATTALGLHRETDIDRPLTLVSEMRRRIFTVIFSIDKASSLLTGRPPALAYRYCRFKLPLDLSNEVAIADEEFRSEVERLDENGWNTDGRIHSATMARVSGSLAIVLNGILELALGDEQCSFAHLRSLLDRLEHTYKSFPDFIRWTPDVLHAPKLSDDTVFHRMAARLQYLEYRLLLERRAHQQGFLDGQSMVDCAREMLELVVTTWVQRDRFSDQHHNYDWMLMCWGVPSSGVLCVELLKQIKSPITPGPVLPRSEIVQNLSLLIGFLEWVRPAAGNYQLCGRMRAIIKSILDRILNGSLQTPMSSQESTQSEKLVQHNLVPGPSTVEAFDAAPGVFEEGWDEELGNLEWLNSVDWSRGPWIDLGAGGGQDYSAARWG